MPSRKTWVEIATIAGLAAVYVAAGKLGLSLARVHPSATAVWPPTGIALAALLVFGTRAWPGVFLGAFIVNLTTAGNAATSAGIAIGNTLEAVIGATLVQRFAHGRRALERPADIFKFVGLAAVASTMVSATLGVLTLCVGRLAAWDGFGAIWLTWWLGDVAGALIVAPLLLLWSVRRRMHVAGRWLETLALTAALLVASLVVFGGMLPLSRDNYPTAFLTIPPVLWAALRFDQRAAALASMALSGIALWGTIHGFGPFAALAPNLALVLLQAFLGVVSVAGLATGALVAERHRALRRAGQARAEAESASRFKDDFLAVVSHELRNPLNVILGYADLLERDPGSGTAFVREAAAAIRRNAQAQAQVVSDLLDLSRLQTGKLALDRRPLALEALVREAAGAMQVEADAKGVALHTDLGNGGCMVEADGVRVQQIIWNLVHNAIKFTPRDGWVRVSLRAAGTEAELVVEDSGAGIAPEFLPHIFEMFQQADASKTRAHGGMGIGLALVRQLVELHGGRVEATSEGTGRGARFTVRLPRSSHAAPAPTEPEARPAGGGALAELRILVVDDTPDVLEMIGMMLRLEGAEVELAASAASALEHAKQRSFDLVVSDVAMPGMDGCDLLRELRRRPETATVPAIALTGFGRPAEVAATRAAGFAQHLVKPVHLQDLVAAVRGAIAERGPAPAPGREA